MAAKDELGRRGEDEAVRYLEQRGLVVLSRTGDAATASWTSLRPTTGS
jgi:hypothetical protein